MDLTYLALILEALSVCCVPGWIASNRRHRNATAIFNLRFLFPARRLDLGFHRQRGGKMKRIAVLIH
jgi:hypothetical protein